MIPTRELLELAWSACEIEGRLDPWVVADHFRVPVHLAERALLMLDPDRPTPTARELRAVEPGQYCCISY